MSVEQETAFRDLAAKASAFLRQLHAVTSYRQYQEAFMLLRLRGTPYAGPTFDQAGADLNLAIRAAQVAGIEEAKPLYG